MNGGVFCAELAEFGEGGGGLAGVDGFSAEGYALLKVVYQACGYEGGGGVEEDDVAARAGDAGEDVVEVGGVGGDVPTGELVERGAGQAGHFWGDAGGFEGGRLAGLGLFDAADYGFAGGGELVDAVGPVDDEGSLGPESGEGTANEEDTAGSKDSDDLVAGSGGVGEGAAEVEDGAEAEGAAEGAEDLDGRVVERGVEEHETGGAEALGGELGREFDGNAESFENVGGPALGGDGTVAVLSDPGSGSGGDEGCAGGDVEGERTAATGADNVNELSAFVVVEGDMGGALAHDLNKAGQLGGLFAAGGEDGDEGGDFDLGDLAGEDFSEDVGGLFAGHGRAIFGEGFEEVFDRGHIPRW